MEQIVTIFFICILAILLISFVVLVAMNQYVARKKAEALAEKEKERAEQEIRRSSEE